MTPTDAEDCARIGVTIDSNGVPMAVQNTFVLKRPKPHALTVTCSQEHVDKWGLSIDLSNDDLRDNGGRTIVYSCPVRGQLSFFAEPSYSYVVVHVSGDACFVHQTSKGCEADSWTRDELLSQLTRQDPPVASLLVLVAMVTEALDDETVEFFLRALEAPDASTRKEAVVAISLVPALAFAPGLRVALQSEGSPRLRAMMTSVLRACES